MESVRPNTSSSLFDGSRLTTISGGEINNSTGDHIRLVNNVFNLYQGTQIDPGNEPTSTSSQNLLAPASDLGQGSASPVNPGMQPHCSVTPETHASTGERESPNARYERHLLAEGHGFPLWAPQPHSQLPLSYRRKGVSIGDVGIITRQGYFDFLFNICLPRGHTSNPEFIPIDFSQVKLSPTDISVLREHDPGSCLLTSSTAKLRGLNFKCNGPEGSILVMPNGAYHEDLLNMSKFQRAASQNAENWYRFAIGTCGRAIGNGELRLVTGCDKTNSWGIATYSDFPPETLKLAASGVQSPVEYTWDYEGRVEAKAGPKLNELLPVDAAGNQEFPWDIRNQCTFLRSFTITLVDDVWETMTSTLVQDLSDNHILNSCEPQSYFSSIISGSFFGFGYPGGSVNVRNQSSRNERSRTHPATIINQMLLSQYPNAKVAISHDNDWCAVVREDDITMPDASELLSRIRQTFMSHIDENGTAYLFKEYAPGTIKKDRENERLVPAVELLFASQKRVLSPPEQHILAPIIPEVASSPLVASLDLTPIAAFNPIVAHPLFVGLLTSANPGDNNPLPFIDILPILPPTLPTFDLLGRLLRDQTFITVPGYSTVAELVRIEVLGRFIHESINWLDHAEQEEREGLISDDRFAKGVQNLCRFYGSLIKLSIVDPADTDSAEMAHFSFRNAQLEEAKALSRVLAKGRFDVDRNMQTTSLCL